MRGVRQAVVAAEAARKGLIVTDEIGSALKRARRERKLPLREVAGRVGISTSLLSQVENGKTQPSVKTLFGLAAALGLSLDELVTGDDSESPAAAAGRRAEARARDARAGIQRKSDNPVLDMENGVRWEKLSTGGHAGLQTLFVTYEGGASSSAEGRSMRHQGQEFACILEGTLRLKLDFDEHELHAGDSFCFDSTRPHLFSNPTTERTTGIWLIFDPHAELDVEKTLTEVMSSFTHASAASRSASQS